MESAKITLEVALEALKDLGVFWSFGIWIYMVLDGCKTEPKTEFPSSPSRTFISIVSLLWNFELKCGAKLGNQRAKVVELVQPLERVQYSV